MLKAVLIFVINFLTATSLFASASVEGFKFIDSCNYMGNGYKNYKATIIQSKLDGSYYLSNQLLGASLEEGEVIVEVRKQLYAQSALYNQNWIGNFVRHYKIPLRKVKISMNFFLEDENDEIIGIYSIFKGHNKEVIAKAIALPTGGGDCRPTIFGDSAR